MALGKRLGLPAASTSTTVTSATNRTSPRRRTFCSSSMRAPAIVAEASLDFEEVVDPRGLQEVADHAPDHEAHALPCFLPMHLMVMDAEQAQAIGAAALAEFEIVGVIDRAGEIRVLVIDAHRQHMQAALDAARRVLASLSHRHYRAATRLA